MSPGRREHVPSRPTWRCRACGIAWPCSAAKLRLLAAYREARPVLLMLLATLWAEAEAERPASVGGAADRYRRFVGWARAGAGSEPGPVVPVDVAPQAATGTRAARKARNCRS